jgi:hypothetical protein
MKPLEGAMKLNLDEILAAGSHYWTPEELPRLLGKLNLLRATLLTIGKSREGRPIFGLRIGRGPLRVSLMAGAHADEPVGASTLFCLCRWLTSSSHADDLLQKATFIVCPQINPDGAHRNASWASKADYTLEEYLQGALREEPGDDMEFGFPLEPRTPSRPENRAVADFLRHQGPFTFHAALHGMAIAEGAWYLINEEKIESTDEFRSELGAFTRQLGVPLHDWDRGGEKGFRRIEAGFCTTPTSRAMKQHFEQQKLWSEADKFLPSSMELIASLGGDPLLMVSELPLFLVTPSPEGAAVPGQNFLEARERLLASRMELATGNPEPLARLKSRFGLTRLPHAVAVKLHLGMIFLGSGLFRREEIEV